MANENNKPVKKFQAGGVGAAIWKNKIKTKDGEDIDVLAVTLDRRYTDKDGNWQSSASLRVNDIPRAQLVLSKAFDYMASKSGDDNDQPIVEEVVA